MALEDTSLMEEINLILTDGPKPVHFMWTAEITANEETIVPMRVLSIDLVRNYDSAYGDEYVVEMIMGSGTFAHDVYPYKNDLTVTLYRRPLNEVGSDAELEEEIETQVLQATLLEDENLVLETRQVSMMNKQAADLAQLKTVRFQLRDAALEQIQMQSTGGIFRNAATPDILRYLLTELSSKIEVDDEHKIEGVDMYPPNNTEPQANVVLPHGIRMVDAPLYLHEQCSGIYSTGFGFYLQKRHWYVYPLYDLKRYEGSLKGLTLINIPKNRFPGIERTYRTTENQVIALVTGDVIHKDDSEAKQLNEGNGLRFSDARITMEAFAEVKDNKALALRSTNNHEYVTEERPNGYNNVQVSPRKITSNTFVEMSRMAMRSGARVQCKWENSEPDLIFPGMPVKYMYLVKDEVVEIYGIVQAVHHYIQTKTPGLSGRRHITHTGFHLFLDKNVEWPDQEGDSGNVV